MQLPFAVSTLILPWLSQAAARQPAAPAALRAGLPSVLSAALATSNALSVLAVARLVARARPLFTVVMPVLASAAILAAAAAAAYLDTDDTTALSGRCIVFSALPIAVLLGAVAAVSSCGTASLASTAGRTAADGVGMKLYTLGQSLATCSTASVSFYAAAVVATASDGGGSSLAAHAAATLASAAAVLVLSLGAYVALPRRAPSLEARSVSEVQHPMPCEDDTQPDADGLTAPLLDGSDAVDEDNATENGTPMQAAPPTADLRFYKMSLFCTYFITCTTYPGISVFLKPAPLNKHGDPNTAWAADSSSAVHLPGGATLRGDLLVPASFVIFAAGDLCGRIAAAAIPTVSAPPLLALALVRSLLLPCICMCNIAPPSGRWAAPRLFGNSDAWPFLWLALAALTNGFITACALAAGPGCRPAHRRGAVATRMMAWLVGGVTAGSLCSVVLSLALQHL